MNDVLRLVGEGAAIDTDHAALAMLHAHHVLAQAPARAGDEDGALAPRQRGRRRRRLARGPHGAQRRGHQKKMLFRALRPRFSIDWMVAFTAKTFSSMSASSSSGSPSKRIGSPNVMR